MGHDRHHPGQPPDDRDAQRTGWARLPWAARAGSGRVLLIAVTVCLCAAVAGVSLAAIFSPPNQADRVAGTGGAAGTGSVAGPGTGVKAPPVPATQPAASAAGRPGATGSEVTSNGIAKTALRWPSALNHQITAWKAGSGGAASSAVTTELGNAMQAAGVRLYVQIKLACRSLSASIRTAQSAAPIPDGAMQQQYAKALTGLSSAAADCQSAVATRPDGDEVVDTQVNQTLLSRSLSGFAAGSRELYTATAQIRALR